MLIQIYQINDKAIIALKNLIDSSMMTANLQALSIYMDHWHKLTGNSYPQQ